MALAYITQADLEDALGTQVVLAIFDDDMDGFVDNHAIMACLSYGSAQVDAYLAGTYDITLPIANPPAVVKFAAVDFACAYATRRRPDLVRAMGEKPWSDFLDAAKENMKLFASSLKRLPAGDGTPTNVGAEARTGDPDNPDLPTPPRTFQDMGDF